MEIFSHFLFATVIATSHGTGIPHQIHLLRPHSGAAGHHVPGRSCLSWRLAVETDNIRDWDLIPESCESYVGHYMLGHQYRKDCSAAAAAAAEYAMSLKLAGDGKDIWIFDVDETALSNLPYFVRPENGFGPKGHNVTKAYEWVEKGIAPPVTAILSLYKRLLVLGFKIAFITGRPESYRAATASNLKKAGYHTWLKLVLRAKSEKGTTAVVYKSSKRKELEEEGYRILGNMGDQWSDLFGTHVGNRTFKVPNPMYYAG